MNKKFSPIFTNPKWRTYEDLTEERVEELRKAFPFMQTKTAQVSVVPQPDQEETEISNKPVR